MFSALRNINDCMNHINPLGIKNWKENVIKKGTLGVVTASVISFKSIKISKKSNNIWAWEISPELKKKKVKNSFLCIFQKINLDKCGIPTIQFSSVAQTCPTLCNPMNHSTPGLPVHHQLPESTQTHVHWVGDAIQPSHPLWSPSPPALNLSQHQGLFKWVSSSHQVAKVLQFQLQHQSFQWTPKIDLL